MKTLRPSKSALPALACGALLGAAVAAQAQAPATVRHEKGSSLEAHFVPYPWRPDIFQSFEEGGPTVLSWAFARLAVSSYFTLDGARLDPGQYAMVLTPKTGALPMTLELRRAGSREFLVDPPALAPPPAGEPVYKKPAGFAVAAEPAPALDLTIASWSGGSLLTIRYGNRKLVLELRRTGPP